MKRFRLSKAAENDLRQICRDGGRHWGEAQADEYLRALDECFHLLGEYHLAAEYLDAYIALAGLADQPDSPLRKNAPGHARQLSGEAPTERGRERGARRIGSQRWVSSSAAAGPQACPPTSVTTASGEPD